MTPRVAPATDGTPAEHHAYWNSFYAGKTSHGVPEEPSAFARWVSEQLQPGEPVAEFGFGTARDSLWFAAQGHEVRGYDFAESAVASGAERAGHQGVEVSLQVLDLYDRPAVKAVAEDLRAAADPVNVYGRFLIHSLEEDGRANLLDLCAHSLVGGGALFLEFRTGEDRQGTHLFGDSHFRVYLDPAVVVSEIEDRGGRVVHEEQGHGFAVYKSEDPHVARLVARWGR